MSILRSLHAWCGAGLSLLMILIGLTGLVSALRSEIVQATTPVARQAPGPSTAFGTALDRFEAARGARVQAVKFAPYGLGVHRLRLEDGSAAFIDPHGAQVEGWRGRGRFEDWALSLHHELLAGQWGGRIVGLAGLAGLGLVVSGVVVWAWPRRRSGYRVWPRSTVRPEVLRAHWSLGLAAAPFLLVQLATGAGMALGEFVAPALRAEAPSPPRVSPAPGPAPWGTILAAAQAAHPNAKLRRAFAPSAPDGPYRVYLQCRGDLNPEGGTVVYLDGRGAVAGQSDIADQGAGAKLYNAFLGVHSGAYGGAAARLVTGLVGLGLATLGAYGAWSFMLGPKVRRRKAAAA